MTILYITENIDQSFVYDDICLLAADNNRVVVIVQETVLEQFNWPNNVELHVLKLDAFIWNFKSILWIFNRLISEVVFTKWIMHLKQAIGILKYNQLKANAIINFCKQNQLNIDLVYAFWFYDLTYFTILKSHFKQCKFIARAHGGDLYEYRSSINNRPLFRKAQLNVIDSLYAVSQNGSQYLKQLYPQYAHKINFQYIGSQFHDYVSQMPHSVALVSCSNIRDVKRVYLIAEALQHINIQLTWYHIGDQNLEAKNDPTIEKYQVAIEALKHKTNIHYKALGKYSHQQVFDFFKSTAVSVFISTSSAEGLPISIMEAMSFGIPILATDVGACNEMINSETGLLMPANVNPQQIADFIISLIPNSQSAEFRQGIRLYWQQHFNLESNHKAFINRLHEIH